MRILVLNLVFPGRVISKLQRVRLSGFPFEWDMAYNNLPSTTVQAMKLFSDLLATWENELHFFAFMRVRFFSLMPAFSTFL
jgi:hypothetical protein